MKIFKLLIVILILSVYSCKLAKPIKTESVTINKKQSNGDEKIKILNFGTFHMGNTNDSYSVDFDENNRKNREKVHRIAKKLAKFKPTVIIVERTPQYNNQLNNQFLKYKKESNIEFENPSEIELLAFEIGRLSDTNRIYGIDYKMEYNYPLIDSIARSQNNTIYIDFFKKSIDKIKRLENENTNVVDKLIAINSPEYLDFLIEFNADNLTHVATEYGFEGADEAAKLYKRNLRMFSNLNKIQLSPNDRVFILLGATHTAFFNNFIKRNHKYVLVNTSDYLK